MYSILLTLFLILIVFGFVIEKTLDFLNAKHFSKPIPMSLRQYFSEDFQIQNLDYKKHQFNYSLINSSLSFLLTLGFWFWGGFGFVMEFVEGVSHSEIFQTLMFFGIIGLFSSILSLPFTYYYHFVMEAKFGFNKMTIKTFILDQLKSTLLIIVLGGGLISLVVWVYELAPNHFWWMVWLLMSAIMIFLSAFYAQIIVPIFNKQTELEEGELKDTIRKMADKMGFSLTNIYVMDGSKRSSKANAYFTGLGRQKRIVLFDTLINDLEISEITAVLAHEIGHYKHKHTLLSMVLGIAQTGIMLYVLSWFISPNSELGLVLNQVVAMNPNLIQTHFYMGIIGFGIVYSPISMILDVLTNILSRRFEYQADAFAANYGLSEELKSGLIKLSKNSLSNLTPHPAYVYVHYSHPPLLARFQALT